MTIRSTALLPLAAVLALSLAACGGSKSGTNSQRAVDSGASPSASGMMRGGAVPNCGATQAVWVNLNTKVYHEPGDSAYGKTKHGEYLCPAEASAQGFRPPGGARHHRHHKQASST